MKQENKFLAGYRATSIMLLNFCVLFLILNAGLAIYYGITDRLFPEPRDNFVLSKYGVERVKRAYPELSDEVFRDLLHESWSRPHSYAPFTQFIETPYSGGYVNVHEAGFRHVADQGPWPPDPDAFNVFVFGGSTTFGYGVSDGDTVASYLQTALADAMGKRVRVYNFGQSFFYSTLERIQFQELLMAGFIPDAAIFLDGINEFSHEKPWYTESIEGWWHDHQRPQLTLGPLKDVVPFLRFVSGVKDRLKASMAGPAVNLAPHNTGNRSEEEWEALTNSSIRRFLENKRQIEAISGAYGVEPVFVWQPNPFYKFDLSEHLFLELDADGGNWPAGYDAMAMSRDSGQLGPNFLWTADIQPTLSTNLYVDYTHYSPAFSEAIAIEIARQAQQNGLFGIAGTESASNDR